MKNLIVCLVGLMLFVGNSAFAGGNNPEKRVKHSKSTEVTCDPSCPVTSCPSTCPKSCTVTSCSTTSCAPKSAKSESSAVSPERAAAAIPNK